MKIKHTKFFLPQRNITVYNGLQPAKMKISYHRFFSHEYFQPLIFSNYGITIGIDNKYFGISIYCAVAT